jgi:hypothetical protein
MNAEQLWDTTLNPDTRRLLPVTLGAHDFATTEARITKLMGKGEAAARLMELHGDSVMEPRAACGVTPHNICGPAKPFRDVLASRLTRRFSC